MLCHRKLNRKCKEKRSCLQLLFSLQIAWVNLFLAQPKPGWRNWQTQRTQNPSEAIPWGFDSPSRHHLKYRYPLLIQRFAALVSAPCLGCFPVDPALGYELRYSAHPLYCQQLGFVCSGLISASFCYLRQITECSGLWFRSSPRYGKGLHCMFLGSDGSLCAIR